MEKNNDDANFQPQGSARILFVNYRSRVELMTLTLRLSYYPGNEAPREGINGVSRLRPDMMSLTILRDFLTLRVSI